MNGAAGERRQSQPPRAARRPGETPRWSHRRRSLPRVAPSRASASRNAPTISARTRPASRKRTSVLAGCTLTSTSRGSMRDEQRHHRMPVARQIVGIGRTHRAEQQLVAHRPAVDEQILPKRIRARVGRQRREAFHMQAFASRRDRDRIGAEIRAQNVAKPREASRFTRQGRGPGHMAHAPRPRA